MNAIVSPNSIPSEYRKGVERYYAVRMECDYKVPLCPIHKLEVSS